MLVVPRQQPFGMSTGEMSVPSICQPAVNVSEIAAIGKPSIYRTARDADSVILIACHASVCARRVLSTARHQIACQHYRIAEGWRPMMQLHF